MLFLLSIHLFFFPTTTNNNNNTYNLKLDEFRLEIQRRDQEIMSMAAKMKTLEEQHQVRIIFLVKSRVNQSRPTRICLIGLSTSHFRAEGIALRQRRTLQYASSRRKLIIWTIYFSSHALNCRFFSCHVFF